MLANAGAARLWAPVGPPGSLPIHSHIPSRIFSHLRVPRDRVPFPAQSFATPGFCVTCRWALTSMGSPYIDGGRRIAQLLGLAPSAPPPGRIPAMLAARRRIIDQPMVPSLTESERLVPDSLVARAEDLAPLIEGGVNDTDLFRRQAMLMRADLGAENIVAGKWGGSFVDAPLSSAGYLGVASYPRDIPNASMARNIRRHEIMHGYNQAAAQGLEGLPFWSRAVAAAPRAIARPLDELIAQRAGGKTFMDVPWNLYASQYRSAGELGAARVAQGLHAAQKAGQFASDYAPYMAGAAVGTGLTAYALTKEEEEDRQALLAYLRSVKPE